MFAPASNRVPVSIPALVPHEVCKGLVPKLQGFGLCCFGARLSEHSAVPSCQSHFPTPTAPLFAGLDLVHVPTSLKGRPNSCHKSIMPGLSQEKSQDFDILELLELISHKHLGD